MLKFCYVCIKAKILTGRLQFQCRKVQKSNKKSREKTGYESVNKYFNELEIFARNKENVILPLIDLSPQKPNTTHHEAYH